MANKTLDEIFETAGIYGMEKEVAEKLLAAKESEGTEVELHAKAGVLGGIAKTEIMGVPIGAAGVGLLTVSIWDAIRGLIGGALPAQIPQWLVPAIGAYVVQTRPIKGIMGADAANAAGLILTADAIQALFNVRGVISGLVGGMKFGQAMRGTVATGGNGHREINSLEEYNKVYGLA